MKPPRLLPEARAYRLQDQEAADQQNEAGQAERGEQRGHDAAAEGDRTRRKRAARRWVGLVSRHGLSPECVDSGQSARPGAAKPGRDRGEPGILSGGNGAARRHRRSSGRSSRYRRWVALAVCAGLLAAAPAGAQGVEWRERFGGAGERPGMFQEECGRCHQRAGPLVRERLTLAGDGLASKATGRDLRDFLPTHFGRRGADEVAAIARELLRVAQGRGWFEVRCGVCHASAEDLARHALILRDGAVVGRYSGRDIADFLRRHGTDSAEEAAFFDGVLRRQLRALE